MLRHRRKRSEWGHAGFLVGCVALVLVEQRTQKLDIMFEKPEHSLYFEDVEDIYYCIHGFLSYHVKNARIQAASFFPLFIGFDRIRNWDLPHTTTYYYILQKTF